AAYESAGGLHANDVGQAVLLREGGDHLGGAGAVLVDQNRDAAVKRLRAETLGDEDDGVVSECVADGQQGELPLAGRNAAEASEALLLVAALGAGSGEAVADGTAIRRQIAHQPEGAEAASRVAAQVDNQLAAVLEGCDRAV